MPITVRRGEATRPAERVYSKIKAHFEAHPYLTIIGINKLLDGFNSGYDVLSPSLLIKYTHSKEEAIAILADFMSADYADAEYCEYVLHYAIADCENMLVSAYQPTSTDKSKVINTSEIYEYFESLKQYLSVVNADGGGTATNYYRQKINENAITTGDSLTRAGSSGITTTTSATDVITSDDKPTLEGSVDVPATNYYQKESIENVTLPASDFMPDFTLLGESVVPKTITMLTRPPKL